MNQHVFSNPRTARSQVLGIDELLAMIFLSCLPDDREKVDWINEWTLDVSSSIQYPQPSEKDAPLLLTHVCRHWRRLALDTPRLWTRLFLLFDGEVTHSVRLLNLRLDSLLFWMERSRSLPISIRCSCGELDTIEPELTLHNWSDSQPEPTLRSWSDPQDKYDAVRKIVDTLHQYKDRWENVSIELSEAGLAQFYETVDHSYPLLKTLELMQPLHDVTDPYNTGKVLCISSAPVLQAVSLTGMQADDSVTLPCGMPPTLRSLGLSGLQLRISQDVRSCQIRKLVLDHVELSDIAISRFPTALPQLQSFTITSHRFTVHRSINSNNIGGNVAVLNSLTELKVQTGEGMSFPLNRISAPNLEQLFVRESAESWSNASDVFDRAIIRFLDRSKAPIKTFYYTTGRKACENISAMLNRLPNLELLNVSYPVLSAAGMRLLEEDPSVCPNLVAIRSDGDFEYREEGTLIEIDVPGVQQVLKLIAVRCRKRRRDTQDESCPGLGQISLGGDQGRNWLRVLAFPMRELHYHELTADPIFANARVMFINTYTSEKDV